jgi:hypothetical protein
MNDAVEQPKLNTGVPWGETDTRDLKWCALEGQSVGEIAGFLCRTPSEVVARMVELGIGQVWLDNWKKR